MIFIRLCLVSASGNPAPPTLLQETTREKTRYKLPENKQFQHSVVYEANKGVKSCTLQIFHPSRSVVFCPLAQQQDVVYSVCQDTLEAFCYKAAGQDPSIPVPPPTSGAGATDALYLSISPLFLKALHVHNKALLFCNESSKIHREAVGIIQQPSSITFRRKMDQSGFPVKYPLLLPQSKPPSRGTKMLTEH